MREDAVRRSRWREERGVRRQRRSSVRRQGGAHQHPALGGLGRAAAGAQDAAQEGRFALELGRLLLTRPGRRRRWRWWARAHRPAQEAHAQGHRAAPGGRAADRPRRAQARRARAVALQMGVDDAEPLPYARGAAQTGAGTGSPRSTRRGDGSAATPTSASAISMASATSASAPNTRAPCRACSTTRAPPSSGSWLRPARRPWTSSSCPGVRHAPRRPGCAGGGGLLFAERHAA